MSKTVIIDTFDGGHAEDLRTHQTNECAQCLNFDIYTNPHKLIPIRDSVSETYTDVAGVDTIELSDVGVCTISGTSYPTAVGYESGASVKPAFYTRVSGAMNGDWSQQAVGAGEFRKGTMVTYQNLAYTMATDGRLQRFDSAGSVTTVGTASGTSSIAWPRPFVHPEDGILYIVWGNVISRWNATTSTFDNTTTILPVGYTATSLTNYGGYLAISMKPTNGAGNSVTYLWGRDITLNTLQGVIDFGEGSLNVIENVGDVLVGLVYPKTQFSSTITNKLDVKVYAGGSVQTVKSIPLTDTVYNTLKLKKDDKLYFAIGGTSSAIWCVYRNKKGAWVVTQERFMYTGSQSAANLISSVQGLNAIGDYFFIASTIASGTPNFYLRATINQDTKTATSVYKTTINPSMPIADRYLDKQLDVVQVAYTGKTNGTITLKYAVDGVSLVTIISAQSATNAEGVIEVTGESATAFLTGREVQFQVETTYGVEIKEIRYRYTTLNSTI